MDNKVFRKYNTQFRKKIINKLNNIINNELLINIYNIIVEDIGHNYSINSNGIFINLNILSDICIDKLLNIIDLNNNLNNNNLNNNINIFDNYKLDDIDYINEMGHKLTNQEKILIKKLKKN